MQNRETAEDGRSTPRLALDCLNYDISSLSGGVESLSMRNRETAEYGRSTPRLALDCLSYEISSLVRKSHLHNTDIIKSSRAYQLLLTGDGQQNSFTGAPGSSELVGCSVIKGVKP